MRLKEIAIKMLYDLMSLHHAKLGLIWPGAESLGSGGRRPLGRLPESRMAESRLAQGRSYVDGETSDLEQQLSDIVVEIIATLARCFFFFNGSFSLYDAY